MSLYKCFDTDRNGNFYLLTVSISYDKKGTRSDTVQRVVHLGRHANQDYTTIIREHAPGLTNVMLFAEARELPESVLVQ